MESAKAFKRKVLLWTNSWFEEELEMKEEFTPDRMDITRLMQGLGFRVRSIDECLPNEIPVPEVRADCRAYRVILMCPQSGRRIEMEAPTSSCKCQSSDSSIRCQSWAIDETAGKKIEEASDSTLQRPSMEMSRTLSRLIEGLLRVMSMFPELNNNNIERLNAELPNSTKSSIQHHESTTSIGNCGSSVMTLATDIAVVTPKVPDTSKSLRGDRRSAPPKWYGSLDTLIVSEPGFSNEIPEPGELTTKEDRDSGPEMDIEVEFDLNATIVQGPDSGNRKFISKSSPAVYGTEQFQRYSTSNFEDEKKSPMRKGDKKPTLLRSNTYVPDSSATNAEGEPSSGPPPRKTPTPMVPVFPQSLILRKLKDVQNTVSDIIFMVTGTKKNPANIDEFSEALEVVVADDVKQAVDTVARPIRCLSDFAAASNLTRSTSKVRSIPRLAIRKRSTSIGGPETPTTSRSGTNAPVQRRKSESVTAGTGGRTATTPKLGGCRLGYTPLGKLRKSLTTHSSTTGTSASTCKETKLSATTTQKSLTPNRRYAHVQATISKSGVNRK